MTTTQTPVLSELTDSLAACVNVVFESVLTDTEEPDASLRLNPLLVTLLTVPKVRGVLVTPNPPPPPGGGVPPLPSPPPNRGAEGAVQEPEVPETMLTVIAAITPLVSG